MRQMASLVVALMCCLAGCASVPIVSGGEIRNLTDTTVHHVRIVLHPTQRLVYANSILAGRSFAIGFNPREMQAKYAELTWLTAKGRQCGAQLGAPSCPAELEGHPTWVVYSLNADGTATCAIEPAR